jgi:hypothetical protein
VANPVSGGARGRQKIGRQIVLPFSKAFEIAWKGIRIRLWRSLITMSGIVLAIAFLMSVWTSSVFNRALRSVDESNPLFPLVQSALETEAIAGGGARIRCAVLQSEQEAAAGSVSAAESIQRFLESEEAFRTERAPAGADSLTKLLRAQGDARPNVLIVEGFPPVLSAPNVAQALENFVLTGGSLIIHGTAGADKPELASLQNILPAAVAQGTFSASGGDIKRAEKAAQVAWQNHPPAQFRNTTGKPDAQALATSGGHAVAWNGKFGAGTVTWYVVAPESADDPSVIAWFVRGQGGAGSEEAVTAATSPLARLVARAAGGASARRDMRGVWLVTLSLMVSVVGITNAMLMSVTERFREIGTMKCLGALDKFVVKLFLIESSLQGVAGSLVGAFIGFVLSFVRALFTFHVKDLETGASYWLAVRFFPALSLLEWLSVALAVGIVLSIVAAIYPAIRAARMEPVQAMRVEA